MQERQNDKAINAPNVPHFPFFCVLVECGKGNRTMRRINQYDYYQLGTSLLPLRQLREGQSVGELVTTIFPALNALEKLLNNELIDLTYSRHETENLKKHLNGMLDKYGRNDKGDCDFKKFNESVPDHALWGLPEALTRFEHNFSAELREAATYFVPKVGMFNTPDSVDRADCHIPEEIIQFVAEQARQEVRLAGKCMAFGLFTACGFRILRAAECVLDAYYKAISGKHDKQLNSWNDYVVELEKLVGAKTMPMPTKRVIRDIRQIKDLDRNPLMHPRDSLDETSARIVFEVAMSAICEMAKELKNIGGQGSLDLVAIDSEK